MAVRRIEPGPGQESVWDYPRPPRVEPSRRRVRVEFDGVTVADSTRALRVLETSGPPVYYVPPEDVRMDLLVPSGGPGTVCEWKGPAEYFDLRTGGRLGPGRLGRRAAWTYPEPNRGYEAIAGWIAFYAGRVDACFLGDEPVRPQPGHFYGGWITSEVVGPFKGEPGTEGW
jgi:uncharacterized protein (DUF427 family)